jgi:DNA polymerase III delta prime subunit
MKKNDILSIVNQKRVPHALLFCGGSLSEKREFALHVAKLLLGDKFMEDLSHPDLYYQETTAIDDVREVTAKLHQTAHQGNYKIVIFALAESMPVGAMNALLKTLEEPPPQTVLILITEFASLLPLTIRSRCQKIIFEETKESVVDQKILKILNQLTPSEAAVQLEKQPLLETLEKLYFIAVDAVMKSNKNNMGLFLWLDEINRSREKLMRKYNPNVLLTLENLFYQWKKYATG